jgi:hypothetical protein
MSLEVICCAVYLKVMTTEICCPEVELVEIERMFFYASHRIGLN